MPSVSAYIPCFNNQTTLAAAVGSIRALASPVAELFVVDDGSTDGSAELARSLGCPVFSHAANLGRGAVRARAMKEAHNDLVLCCDATNALAPDFLCRALRWLDNPNVAAAYGRFVAGEEKTVFDRWRSRHLFKTGIDHPLSRRASLITSAAVVRKSLHQAAGGYDPLLRHSEDAELGQRLLAAGYEVVFDPAMEVTSLSNNTLGQLLERYWRWYAGKDEEVGLTGYARQVVYAMKVMTREDLAAGDPLGIPISLLAPHYQFWKSVWRRLRPGQRR